VSALTAFALMALAARAHRAAGRGSVAMAAEADTSRRAPAAAATLLDSFPAELQRVNFLRGLGRYPASDSVATSLMARLAAAGQGDSSRTADVLDQWVLTRILWGRFGDDTVRAAGNRSLAIRSRRYGAESVEAALSLNVLGRLTSYQGRAAESDSLYRRALAIQERVQGPNAAAVGQTYQNLGNLHINSGKFVAARDEYLHALEIAKRNNPAGSPVLGGIENNLANAYVNLGEYGTARGLYEHSISLTPADNANELSRRLYNYARLLQSIGDYDSSQAVLRRTLDIRLKTVGPRHSTVGLTYWRMAYNEYALGELDSAEADYQRAAAIVALGSQRKRDLAYILSGRQVLALARGDLDASERLADSSLTLMREFFGPDNIPVASKQADVGDLRLRRGDARGALQSYQVAAASARACCSENSTASFSVMGTAWANIALGDYDAAARAAIDAGGQGRSAFSGFGVGLGERYALRMTATSQTVRDLAVSGAIRSQRAELVSGAYRVAATHRAQIVDAVSARHRAWESSPDSTVQQLWRDLDVATRRLANLAFSEPEEYNATAVRAARDERDRLDAALARRSADYDRQRGAESFTCGDLARSLPPGTALVSYVRYGDCRPADSAAIATPLPPSYAWPRRDAAYAAFVMRAGDSSVSVFALGPATAIDFLVADWRERVLSAAERTSDRASRVRGVRLRERIWDPLAGALRGAERVFIVPDGTLNLVSFAALPDSTGYLAEHGPLLHYLGAERELLEPALATGEASSGLLAMGGVDFSAVPARASSGTATYRGLHSTCADFQAMRFEPLPGSLREAREVRSVWETAAGADSSRSPRARVKVLVGAEATEDLAKREMGRFGMVHIATHGFFLEGPCGNATPGTRGIGGMTDPMRDSLAVADLSEEPLLLSGLALAGANHRGAARRGGEDGILTAEEIALLDLSGVGWAVLSGCDTGTGEIHEGEGVFGLRRAFRIAGAHTLIMSLWPVMDDATRAWMRELYRARLGERLSTPEAMRAACVASLRERRRLHQSTSPFFWGAFVAAGDWR
jgi:CHAT domain-containing protein/tetratricopeptide (TPR) repeat protein